MKTSAFSRVSARPPIATRATTSEPRRPQRSLRDTLVCVFSAVSRSSAVVRVARSATATGRRRRRRAPTSASGRRRRSPARRGRAQTPAIRRPTRDARTGAQPASAEQRARRRSDERLHEADEQQAVAGDRVDDAEQIRIQRRLVEDVVADPVAAGDAPRPFVVAARVAHQHREERRAAELPDVNEPHDQRTHEDRASVSDDGRIRATPGSAGADAVRPFSRRQRSCTVISRAATRDDERATARPGMIVPCSWL